MDIRLLQGDITTLAVDAIVNAANNSLSDGSGVNGAIHRAGGKAIYDECEAIFRKRGGCPTGEAVITSGGNLPAKHVIHAVGPVWHGGAQGEPDLLASCYRSCLGLCVEHGLHTVAFPNISTGIFGYPKAEAAGIAVRTVRNFDDQGVIDIATFVCFDADNHRLYQDLLK